MGLAVLFRLGNLDCYVTLAMVLDDAVCQIGLLTVGDASPTRVQIILEIPLGTSGAVGVLAPIAGRTIFMTLPAGGLV